MKTIDIKSRSAEHCSQLSVEDFYGRIDATRQWFRNSQEDHLGHLEQELKADMDAFMCFQLQRAAQQKADDTPPNCPRCGAKLTRCRKSERTIQTASGEIRIARVRGYCAKCEEWFVPADERLGLDKGYSPQVQEMAAMFASKMPISEAAKVMKKATGIDLAPTTLDRVAKSAAKKAEQTRRQMDKSTVDPDNQEPACKQSHTLIIQIDAWNIRERDDWGDTQKLLKKGQEIKRWHWVWTATVFGLDQRLSKGGRPIIIERGFVATRQGVDALREQLHAEAMRRGLAHAKTVIVLGDGASWIWKLAGDRFPEAIQRLDLYHLHQHLHSLSRQLFEEAEVAQKWCHQMKKKLRKDKPAKVIESIEQAIQEYEGEMIESVNRELNYVKEHSGRMDYGRAHRRGEPLGTGAIESTCRQYQCRFKRTGQFWSTEGDEAYLCLDTFWRNERWERLFPPSSRIDLSQN